MDENQKSLVVHYLTEFIIGSSFTSFSLFT